jgi:hypothetical protein
MRKTICLAMMLSVPFFGGCATILRGTHQDVEIRTVPSGASVMVDGKPYTSPVKVSLARKQVHQVVIAKEGYRSLKFAIDPIWDGVSLVGNIIMPGGSVGLIYDAADGADKTFYKLAKIELTPTTQPDQAPLVLHDFKGHLLTTEQVAQAERADRLDRSEFFRGQP